MIIIGGWGCGTVVRQHPNREIDFDCACVACVRAKLRVRDDSAVARVGRTNLSVVRPAGRTTDKFVRPTLATAESSRTRSFARTHATQAQSKSISRFGCCLTTVPHPQPPIIIIQKSSGAKRSQGVSEARTHPLGNTRTLEEIIIGTDRNTG